MFDEDIPANDAEEEDGSESDDEDDGFGIDASDDEGEELIMVEPYQTTDGVHWFETFLSLGRILEEIDQAMQLDPEFLPILQQHFSAMPIIVCFLGDLDDFDVTEAWIMEVDTGYPVELGEAEKEAVRSALDELSQYLGDENHSLASLLSNALLHQGHNVIAAQRGEATPETEQTGIRQLDAIPVALEIPFAGIRALERDAESVDLSNSKEGGDLAEGEDDDGDH